MKKTLKQVTVLKGYIHSKKRKPCKTPDVIYGRSLGIDINSHKFNPFVIKVREIKSLLM